MSASLNVLFICNENRLRSPTAESLYKTTASIKVKSAGINTDCNNPVTGELLAWADIIFVMEKRQINIIQKKFKEQYQNKRIICLYIPDEYDYMDKHLILLLKDRLHQHIGLPDEQNTD